MPNPFFSARIPPDLFKKIEQHITETGESKTQILIKALAAYVNHPANIQEAPTNSGVSLELFSALEERVVALEKLLQPPEEEELAISDKNSCNQAQLEDTSANKVVGKFDILSDLWLDTSIPTPQTKADNTDNSPIAGVVETNKVTLLLAPPPSNNTNQADNIDNIDNTTKDLNPQQVELFNLPEGSIGPYSESRIAEELKIDRNRLRKHSKQIEEGKITPNTPIEVIRENQLYHAMYLGKPHSRKLWMAKLVEPESCTPP